MVAVATVMDLTMSRRSPLRRGLFLLKDYTFIYAGRALVHLDQM
jgi:hypothetical protein